MVSKRITLDKVSPIYQNTRERFLYIYITQECNLRCKHCYVGSNRLNQAYRFDFSELRDILAYFRVIGGHDKLYIEGGEPTLHPQLPEIVELANQEGYSVTISSNGQFPASIFSKIPPNKLTSFNFSLESWKPEIHTKIRGDPRNFEAVTNNIRLARKNGYQVRVMCTVSKANYETAIGMIRFVAELGAQVLSYHNLGLTGNAVQELTPLSPNEWIRFCDEIEAHELVRELAVYYPPTFVYKEDQKKVAMRSYPGCTARTFDRPHIYPDGTVSACPLFMDTQHYYARWENGQLVLNKASDGEMNMYLHVNKLCLDCDAKDTCGGGCPAYAVLDSYTKGFYECNQHITPLCILWTTYAWNTKPEDRLHDFR